jgi:hypothetical protein
LAHPDFQSKNEVDTCVNQSWTDYPNYHNPPKNPCF